MPISTITRDDAVRIRANLERAGRPVPDALKDATGEPAAPAAEPPATTPPPAPAPVKPKPVRSAGPALGRSQTAPAGKRNPPSKAAGAPPSSSSGSSSSGKKAKARKDLARRAAGSSTPQSQTARGRARSILRSPSTLGGGDGGGLILAFWLYPLVLAIIQEGSAGPGIWLRAKFLNIDSTPPAGSKWKGNAIPAAPGAPVVPVAPGDHGLLNIPPGAKPTLTPPASTTTVPKSSTAPRAV